MSTALRLVDSDPHTATWWDFAACLGTDTEAFYPDKGGSTRGAKNVCARCPVTTQCLDFALATHQRFGIWGGLSERERARLLRKAS